MAADERRALRVLVVGPRYASPASRGGMATIVMLMREQRDDRVQVRTVATYVDSTRPRRLAVGVSGMLVSTLRVLARRTDVLHVHLAHKGSVMRKALPLLAAQLVGIPAVIHAHSYDFAGWFDELPAPLRSLVRYVLPAQRWLVLGRGLALEYRARMRLRPDQVVVLANPAVLPAEDVIIRPPADIVQVAALGRLGQRKGSYDLLAAVSALDPATRARMHLTLAGDGDVDTLRHAVGAAGLTGIIDLPGWLGPGGRDAVLTRSEIFVLPSYAEGLPMAMLEAMGWGLVPIVTAVGSVGEIVTDGMDALVIEPGDIAALTRALDALLTDDARRRRMGAAARARATDFGVDAWFEHLVTVWTQLVPRR